MNAVRTYGQLLPVEQDLHPLAGTGHIVSSAGEQRHDVLVQLLHLELCQVGLEGHTGEVVAVEELDLGLRRLSHVVLPRLMMDRMM